MSITLNENTISDTVRTSIFISYSRAQKLFAEKLAKKFKANSSSIWFDRDAISVGDDWMNEIRMGIERCDEFLALISAEALQSKVVAKEVEIANQLGKPIIPVVLGDCVDDLPGSLLQTHYLEIDEEDDVNDFLDQYFSAIPDDISNLKILATRSVFPEFTFQNGSAFGRYEEAVAKRLGTLAFNYSDQSAILLNKGLLDARNENWEQALQKLKKYAYAADNFAGWYFYALHLPQKKNVRTLSAPIVEEINSSIERAKLRGSSPLIELYHDIVLVAGYNYSRQILLNSVSNFESKSSNSNEKSSEYLRFIWCTKDSLSVLGPQKSRIVSAIKGKTL